MTNIAALVKRAILNIPLGRPSPARIPRSGDAGMAVNCYTTCVFGYTDEPLIVESARGDSLNCRLYDGQRYAIQKDINFDELLKHKWEFTHYHGLNTIVYSGWLDFAIGFLFRAPYVKAWTNFNYDKFSQKIYNRRKLVTKQRIDLLKEVLNAQLNGKDGVSSLSVMSALHSEKWYLHPNREDELHRVDFYLNALVDTGELERIGIDYSISGAGIAAIEGYEEQEIKHSQNIAIQRRMFWLTAVIVLLTLVQAGLVRLPTIIDWSGKLRSQGTTCNL